VVVPLPIPLPPLVTLCHKTPDPLRYSQFFCIEKKEFPGEEGTQMPQPHLMATRLLSGVYRNFSREGFRFFFAWTRKFRGVLGLFS